MNDNAVGYETLIKRLEQRLFSSFHNPDFTIAKVEENQRGWQGGGNYYCLNMATGSVVELKLDLEEFARETGILREYEVLIEKPSNHGLQL